jgi:Carboxypeptidase regulatory-like domain
MVCPMRSLRTLLFMMLVSTGACMVQAGQPHGGGPPPSHESARSAMLAGNVVDAQTHQPIGRAAIDVVVAGVGKYTQQTDASGNFAMTDIPPGEYALRVRRDGFRPWEQTHVMLRAGENPPLNVALERK